MARRLALLFVCVACSRDEAELSQIFDSRSPRPLSSETRLRQRQRRPPGENPFGLASAPLRAQIGDFVLAPSPATLEQAFEQGPEQQTFAYHGAWIDELGPLETRVRFLTHERRTLPNALLVPIRRGGLASPGDTVLTARATGAGLVRALVVGGEPSTPQVTYLDPIERVAQTPERAAAEQPDTLSRDTFHALREPGEPGTSVACRGEVDDEPGIALRRGDGRWLVLGFAGRLRTYPDAACRGLPLRAAVEPGAGVRFPLLAGFGRGQVERVDAGRGRVWVEFRFAGERRFAGVGFGNFEPSPAAAP